MGQHETSAKSFASDESTEHSDIAQIAPGLLIASTALDDPNFERSVILMLEHSDEGAVGIVLNRESDTPIMDLCLDQGITSDDEEPIRIGGPLSGERIWIVHRKDAIQSSSFELSDGVGVSVTKEALEELTQTHALANNYLVCAGYAGWGPGQLESEIQAGAWLPYPVESRIVFDIEPDSMWSQLLLSLGQFSHNQSPDLVN